MLSPLFPKRNRAKDEFGQDSFSSSPSNLFKLTPPAAQAGGFPQNMAARKQDTSKLALLHDSEQAIGPDSTSHATLTDDASSVGPTNAPGPESSSLPNEVLLEIFGYALAMGQKTPLSAKEFYACLSKAGRLGRFLAISKGTVPLVIESFYKYSRFQSDFDFRSQSLFTPFGIKPLLPPTHVRHRVRQFHVHISLHDYAYGDSSPTHVTFENLSRGVPGWAQLATLTNDMGFTKLDHLNITLDLRNWKLTEDYRGLRLDILTLIRSQGICVKARSFEVQYTFNHRWWKLVQGACKDIHGAIKWQRTGKCDAAATVPWTCLG